MARRKGGERGGEIKGRGREGERGERTGEEKE